MVKALRLVFLHSRTFAGNLHGGYRCRRWLFSSSSSGNFFRFCFVHEVFRLVATSRGSGDAGIRLHALAVVVAETPTTRAARHAAPPLYAARRVTSEAVRQASRDDDEGVVTGDAQLMGHIIRCHASLELERHKARRRAFLVARQRSLETSITTPKGAKAARTRSSRTP